VLLVYFLAVEAAAGQLTLVILPLLEVLVVEVLEATVLPPGELEMLVLMERRRQEAVLVGAGTMLTGVLGVAG
jgi:hypothetical protein